jgi:ABC-2 type transport system ATP-binding protein
MLEAAGVTKRYKDIVAVDSLDLAVKPGEVFCLLGANGAGKTTTIHLFLNFVAPSSGTLRVGGCDVVKNAEQARRLAAYLPEQVMLYPKLTGFENLRYFSRLSGQRHGREQLLAYLDQCGLPLDAADRPLSGYSKGMRQKVGIAIALAKQAKALLLDEPTSGLDPQASWELSGLIASLARNGVAVLMATHDLFRVKETGTRAGIMKKGRLVSVLDTKSLTAADLEKIYVEHMQAHAPARASGL